MDLTKQLYFSWNYHTTNTRKLYEDEQLNSLVRSFALVFYIILSNVTTIVGVLRRQIKSSQPSTLSSQSSRSSSAFFADWTVGFTDGDGTITDAEVTWKKNHNYIRLGVVCQRNLNCVHYVGDFHSLDKCLIQSNLQLWPPLARTTSPQQPVFQNNKSFQAK